MSEVGGGEGVRIGLLRGATLVHRSGSFTGPWLYLVGLHIEVEREKHVRLAVYSDRSTGWFWKHAGCEIALDGRAIVMPGADASLEGVCGCARCIVEAYSAVTSERYSQRFAGDKFAVCLHTLPEFERAVQ